MKRLLAAALFAALPHAGTLAAEEPLSPTQFREYAEGWTLYFDRDGQPFGSETFEPDGKVRWRYRDGSCVDGNWRPHGAQLCFLYDAENAEAEVLCWRVLRQDDGGLIARLLNSQNAGMELNITRRDKKPLLCGSPGTET